MARRVALLIGTEKYQSPLKSLASSLNDVKELKRVLINPNLGCFNPEEVEILENATASEICQKIEDWYAELKKDDFSLLFITGHGFKDDNFKLHFATTDTRKVIKHNFFNIFTAVPAERIRQLIERSKATQKILILNCCYSGAYGNMTAMDDSSIDIGGALAVKGSVVLTSTSSMDYAFEELGQELSVYTRYFLEGITTGDADVGNKGYIAINDLHEYICQKLYNISSTMSPQIFTENQGGNLEISKRQSQNPEKIYEDAYQLFVSENKNTTSLLRKQRLSNLRNRHTISTQRTEEIEQRIDNEDLDRTESQRKNIDACREAIKERILNQGPIDDSERQKVLAEYHLSAESEKNVWSEQLPWILAYYTKYLITKRFLLVFIVLIIPTILLLSSNYWKGVGILVSPIQSPESVENFQSLGDEILLDQECDDPKYDKSKKEEFESLKRQGARAFKDRNYEQAATFYEKARTYYKNAPETLIYLNNSKILRDKDKQPAYTLAVVVPTDNRNRALEMLRGFAQAQDEINNSSGGIGRSGAKLKLHIFNDNDNKEKAGSISKMIIDYPDILAVMGHWSSSTSLAFSKFYSSSNITLVTPISTTTELMSYKNTFRMNTTTKKGGKILASYALDSNHKKIFAIYDRETTYSKDLFSSFKESLKERGGNIVGSCVDGSSCGSDEFKKLDQEGLIDTLLIIPGPENEKLTKSLDLLKNRNGLNLIGDIANLYSPITLDRKQDTVGMVMSVPYVPNSFPSLFRDNSTKLWGGDGNWASAMSYNSAQVLIEALRQIPNPRRENIQPKLSEKNFSANGVLDKKIEFSENVAIGDPYLVIVRTDQNAPSGYSFQKLDEKKE